MLECPHRGSMSTASVLLAGLASAVISAYGDDWPTYRHDIARSGVTKEQLKLPLAADWTYEGTFPPEAAWGDPQPKPIEGNLELPRVRFDDAFHTAIVGNRVYFGSSSDNKVYCLNASTGEVAWVFHTRGPVRLAPTVTGGRVYVGSDDGHVYCLDAESGREVWQVRAAPSDQRALGHGKMVSLWPVRTSVLVDNGIAYFAAGVFPYAGLYLFAVRADSGELVWRTDSEMWLVGQAISLQGYLLATADTLFATTGRTPPAAFRRSDGEYVARGSQSWRRDGLSGGTFALIAGGHVYSGTEQIMAFDRKSVRTGFAWFHGRRLIVTEDASYMLTAKELAAIDRSTFPAASQERQKRRRERYQLNAELRGSRGGLKTTRRRVAKAKAKLVEIDKQLAVFKGKEEQESKAATDLRSEREEANKQLLTDTEQLEGLTKQSQELKERDDTLKTAEQKAAAAVGSTMRWRRPCDCIESMVVAGGLVFAGGNGKVIAADTATGETKWTGQVEGKARGLAVANGRLFVSTDAGRVHAFAVGATEAKRTGSPRARRTLAADKERAAEAIVADSGVGRGFALVIGCGTGDLAASVAKRTDLMIYAVDERADRVEAARAALDSVGLAGGRVMVEVCAPGSIPYTDYFANLIVVDTPKLSTPAAELLRMLKPLGGVAYVPHRGETETWLKGLGNANVKIERKGQWVKITRGALPGAGQWTHQYGEPGNTACSGDDLVRAPLDILWFGEPGPGQMPSRHASIVAPLSIDGRLFVQAENTVMAYDAYNGVKLWQRDIPGITRLGTKHGQVGNMALTKGSLFATAGTTCHRLDVATGEPMGSYQAPTSPDSWGSVAVVGDTLFGSNASGRGVANTAFALDVESAKPRWVHRGKVLRHQSMAIGDGCMFVVEEGTAGATVRTVIALDVRTGEPRWTRKLDLTGSLKVGIGGGELSLIYKDQIVLLCSQPYNGHFWRQFHAGEFKRRTITALSSRDGKTVWSGKIGYRSRPLVVDNTIIAEPWAHDLHTGKPITRRHPFTDAEVKWQFLRPGHHCGCVAASRHCLLFRSGTIAYCDLHRGEGTVHFGAQRPGCWINFVAANGLLLIPEASSGCVCPFPIHCTLVMHPTKKNRGWGAFSAPGPTTPVKQLALNFGALGDRRDDSGKLWAAYPRPSNRLKVLSNLGLWFQVGVGFPAEGKYFRQSEDVTLVKGTDAPWLYASGCAGITRCSVPLVGKNEQPGVYTVRLGFCEPKHAEAGQRVFDVKIQGRTAMESLDIAKEAGGPGAALVKAFSNIEVVDDLVVELLPKQGSAGSPILNTLEVERARVLQVRVEPTSFYLSDLAPEQTQQLKVTNVSGEPFVGMLRFESPDGLALTPGQRQIKLQPKEELVVAMTARVAGKLAVGEYGIPARLTRQDGAAASLQYCSAKYVGDLREMVIKCSEDASVRKGQPKNNHGTAQILTHDGGAAEMLDGSHAIVYLKFRLNVPGRVKSLRLRMRVGTSSHAQSRDAGRIFLVKGQWSENKITYQNQPELGEQLGSIGKVDNGELFEREVKVPEGDPKELSLALVPTTTDGGGYLARESGQGPELVIELTGR